MQYITVHKPKWLLARVSSPLVLPYVHAFGHGTRASISPSNKWVHINVRHLNETTLDVFLGYLRRNSQVVWVHAKQHLHHHTTYAASDVVAFPTPPVSGPDAGANGTILIADTGLDVGHCFFSSAASIPYAQVVNDVPLVSLADTTSKVRAYISFCLSGSCTDTSDTANGHGTHVSGIAVGKATCSPTHGVAPQARIVMADLSVPGTQNLEILSSMETLIKTGADLGATASSFSWGSDTNDGTY